MALSSHYLCSMLYSYFIPVDVLPLVEFNLEDGISDEEACHLINMEPPRKKSSGDKWKEQAGADVQTMSMNSFANEDDEDNDPFTARLLSFEVRGSCSQW